MWTIVKSASVVSAAAIGYFIAGWSELLPPKNAEWGPLTPLCMLAGWTVVFGFGVVGYLTPDFVARNLYRLEQPVALQFSLRTLIIVTMLVAVVLGLVAWWRS